MGRDRYTHSGTWWIVSKGPTGGPRCGRWRRPHGRWVTPGPDPDDSATALFAAIARGDFALDAWDALCESGGTNGRDGGVASLLVLVVRYFGPDGAARN